jgi:hypothetical protein
MVEEFAFFDLEATFSQPLGFTALLLLGMTPPILVI